MRIRPSLSLLVLARAVYGPGAAAPLAKLPEFEVADVQISKSANSEQGKGRMLPGGLRAV